MVKDKKYRFSKVLFYKRNLADGSENFSWFISLFQSNVWNWKKLESVVCGCPQYWLNQMLAIS